jgi:hypothetical protein
VVVAGALSVAAAGCGGGSSSAAPSTLDSASLIGQANRICKALNHTPQGLTGQAAVKAGLRTFDTDLARLRNLHPNASNAAAYARFLVATAKERPLIVAEDNAPPTQASGPAAAAYAQIAAAGQIAAKLHLAQCALFVDTSLRPASATDYRQLIEVECTQFVTATRLVPHPTGPAGFADYVRALDPLFGQLLRDVRAQRSRRTAPRPSNHGATRSGAPRETSMPRLRPLRTMTKRPSTRPRRRSPPTTRQYTPTRTPKASHCAPECNVGTPPTKTTPTPRHTNWAPLPG